MKADHSSRPMGATRAKEVIKEGFGQYLTHSQIMKLYNIIDRVEETATQKAEAKAWELVKKAAGAQ